MNKSTIIKKALTKLSLSDPKLYENPKKFDDGEFLAAIRYVIIAEMDAINLYESLKVSTDNKEFKDLIEHIITEEKQHAAELQNLLNKHDLEQKKIFEDEVE